MAVLDLFQIAFFYPQEGERCLKWYAAIAADWSQCAIKVVITSVNVTMGMFTTAKHKPVDK